MTGSTTLHDDLRAIFRSEPAALADPFPVWNHLRDEHAVLRLDEAMLVGRHALVGSLMRDVRFLSNSKGRGSQFEAIRARLGGEDRVALDEVTAFEANYVSRNNGEAHARLRRIAQRAFHPQRIAALKERIRWHMDDLMAETARQDGFDLKALAYRLPLRVIGELLEIDAGDLEQIHAWSDAVGRNRGGTDTPALLAAHHALREFRSYTESLVARNRRRGVQGDGSIVDLLIGAEQEERLSAVELTAMFVILLFAGHETTTNLIASGIHQLLVSGEWDRLVAAPEAIPTTVEEMIRTVTPVQFAGRVASEDIEVAGEMVPAGTTLYLILAAANRDPAVFQEPDRMDVMRKDVRGHLAFGYGPHLCIGLQLARLEAATVLEELVSRHPSLGLAEGDLRWGGHAMLRGLVELPVRFAAPAEHA